MNSTIAPWLRGAEGARLALGTAQFGLDYGISNIRGKLSPDAAREILATAAASGCDTLDTAIAYGESEARLGTLGVQGWRIVSKLPRYPQGTTDLQRWAREQVQGSLRRLGVERLDTLLLHAPDQLSGGRGAALFSALTWLRDEGMVGRVGVSIYSPRELETLVPRFAFDVVQAPFNVLDRGLLTTGWAARLVDLGVEIHVRSVFLQGSLLMRPGERPAIFSRWEPIWNAWDQWLAETGASAVAACIGHAMSQPWAAKVVVGVAGAGELAQIIAACESAPYALPDQLACEDALLINPSLWKLQ